MTRGTFIACVNKDDNYKLLVSTEFNGDMYTDDPAGRGFNALNGLTDVSNEAEFREFVKNFNEENFGYKEELLFEVKTERIKWNKIMEIFEDGSKEPFDIFSDYVFYINLSDEPMEVLGKNGVYELAPEGFMVLNFGKVALNVGHEEILYRTALTTSSTDWADEYWRCFLDKLDEDDAKYLADSTNAKSIDIVYNSVCDFGEDRIESLGLVEDYLMPYFDCEKYGQDILVDAEYAIELPSGKVVIYEEGGR